jgi:hypothetical protein
MVYIYGMTLLFIFLVFDVGFSKNGSGSSLSDPSSPDEPLPHETLHTSATALPVPSPTTGHSSDDWVNVLE